MFTPENSELHKTSELPAPLNCIFTYFPLINLSLILDLVSQWMSDELFITMTTEYEMSTPPNTPFMTKKKEKGKEKIHHTV